MVGIVPLKMFPGGLVDDAFDDHSDKLLHGKSMHYALFIIIVISCGLSSINHYTTHLRMGAYTVAVSLFYFLIFFIVLTTSEKNQQPTIGGLAARS